MKVEFIRSKQIEEVGDLILGFSHRYVTDTKDFVITTESYGFSSTETAEHLSRLLRKWQACNTCEAFATRQRIYLYSC